MVEKGVRPMCHILDKIVGTLIVLGNGLASSIEENWEDREAYSVVKNVMKIAVNLLETIGRECPEYSVFVEKVKSSFSFYLNYDNTYLPRSKYASFIGGMIHEVAVLLRTLSVGKEEPVRSVVCSHTKNGLIKRVSVMLEDSYAGTGKRVLFAGTAIVGNEEATFHMYYIPTTKHIVLILLKHNKPPEIYKFTKNEIGKENFKLPISKVHLSKLVSYAEGDMDALLQVCEE